MLPAGVSRIPGMQRGGENTTAPARAFDPFRPKWLSLSLLLHERFVQKRGEAIWLHGHLPFDPLLNEDGKKDRGLLLTNSIGGLERRYGRGRPR